MWIVCLDSRFSHHLFFEQTQCFIHFSAESSRAKEKGNDPTKYFAIDRNRIVMKRNSGMVVRWPGVQSIVSIVPLSIRCNEDVDDQNVVGIPFARSRSTSSASHFRWFEIIERVWLRSKYRRYVPLQSQGPGAFLFPNVFLRIMVMIDLECLRGIPISCLIFVLCVLWTTVKSRSNQQNQFLINLLDSFCYVCVFKKFFTILMTYFAQWRWNFCYFCC